ncbi:MAG TPA: carbon-nitrogen hydrolase family protein [Gammaproteobacteria bacterium]|nr:carbon-nitrogen hydrolase family protein [Gammaproteobacteria bacterium]
MSKDTLRVAALQMVSGSTVQANLMEADRLATRAASEGAKLLVLPEYFALMAMKPAALVAAGEADGHGPIQDFLADLAARLGVWIVGGTVPIKADESRVYGTTPVYDGSGTRVARYDKIHLFDAHLDAPGETYGESAFIHAGDRTVVLDTPFGRLGLAVCYDLRFPELFRRLAADGAEIIALPSAFTALTGQAHWEVLVRARAIENLCYVVAAAQGGYHVNGRTTFGDTMIVDPWGMVLGRIARGGGTVVGDLAPERLKACRQSLPALTHRRLTSVEAPAVV